MALKTLIKTKEIESKRGKLEANATRLSNIEEEARELVAEFDKIKDSDDPEKLEALIKADDELESERDALTLESEELEQEIASLEQEIETLNRGVTTKKPMMRPADLSIRETFNEFLHKRAEGFTSPDGELIIPTDVIYSPRNEVFTEYNLLDYVNKVSVSTPSGSWPILKRATAKLHTVEELEQNPELAKPQFESVSYEVSTYRGSIQVSEESIADAAVDLVSLISRDIQIQELNTTNDLIGEVFKSFTQKTVTNIDELKTILNVDLDPAYQRRFIMSQSMYNALDQLKDDNGNYLVQKDITDASVRRLLGYPITVVRDELIGESAGDKVCFVGDPQAAITYFNRAEISARWVDHTIYGQLLMIGFRCDVKATDEHAGFYVTFNPSGPIRSDLSGAVRIDPKKWQMKRS